MKLGLATLRNQKEEITGGKEARWGPGEEQNKDCQRSVRGKAENGGATAQA